MKPTTTPYDRAAPKKDDRVDFKRPMATPLYQETLNDLRRKKLCFHCRGPYDANHDCPMKPKGKNKMMEWFYDDDCFDFFRHPADFEHDTHESSGDGDEEIDDYNFKVVYLSSMRKEGAFRMHGLLAGQCVIALFDTGATHNFIDSRLVAKRGIKT